MSLRKPISSFEGRTEDDEKIVVQVFKLENDGGVIEQPFGATADTTMSTTNGEEVVALTPELYEVVHRNGCRTRFSRS